MSTLRASIIVPVKDEGNLINIFLNRISENVKNPIEVLVIVDSESDLTLEAITDLSNHNLVIKKLISSYGPGPANAIKFGIHSASTNIAVVTMADGSDDPRIIDDLILLIERGCAVVSASRYMPGGQQIGGRWLKKQLSKKSSLILKYFAGVATYDSTNSFKAYSIPFVLEVGIESNKGFEIGLELTAKAHRRRMLIAEIPTIWIDRSLGVSKFQIKKWLPYYIKWFIFAFGISSSRKKGSL